MTILHMFNAAEIGQRVRLARKAAGLTQSALARSVDVQGQTIWALENKGTDAKSSTIIGIAKACHVTVEYLLTGAASQPGPAFIAFLDVSPLGQTATPEEQAILSAPTFPDHDQPPLELYEKWLIDLRSEWKKPG